MSGRPISSGEIPSDGAVSLLRAIEENRTTGVLRFEHEGEQGDVALEAGQLADDQHPMPDGRDPVEVLLSLPGGRYEIYQRLPPLPVTRGDGQCREGSLAVHVPADLMNYCERIGLTGVLTLWREDRCAEIAYDRGELTAIRLDGQDDDDLREVFGWEKGSFRIDARPSAPEVEGVREREPGAATNASASTARDVSGGDGEPQLLRVMEVALTQIVSDRESFRPGSKSEPPERRSGAEAPASEAAAAEPSPAPPAASGSKEEDEERTPSARPRRRRRRPTVKVVYLGGGATAPAGSASPSTGDPAREHAASSTRGTSSPSRGSGRPSGKGGRQRAPSSRATSAREQTGGTSAGTASPSASRGLDAEASDRVKDRARMSSESRPDGPEGKQSDSGSQPEHETTDDVADWREGLVTLAWTVVALGVMLAAIAVLARLPELG